MKLRQPRQNTQNKCKTTFGILLLLAFGAAGAFAQTPAPPSGLRGGPALDFLRQNELLAPLAGEAADFVEEARLLAADGAAQDNLGYSVAVSGDTAVVGAPRASGGTGLAGRGAVYVYVRAGGAWAFQQKLVGSDSTTADQFGYAVAISGNTIAVGRQNTTVGVNRADGKVYIFTRSGATWTETQTLQSSDVAQGDLFGNALAFEGDTLVAGALNKTVGANFFQGAVYVFTRPAGGAFTQQARLTAADGGFADFFGYSVALSGETVVVGAPGSAGQPNSAGKAYVFTRSGATWAEQQRINAADASAGDAFGFAVAVSGDTAVVGARLDDVGAVGDQGSAYVFVRTGAAWTQAQQLFGVELTQRNDQFGAAVAIRGETIAVGAPAHEIVSGIANHGAVYIFTRAGGAWSRSQKLIHNDPAPDALGQSLAFDGAQILTGAPSKNSARGAAYVFRAAATNNQAKILPPEVFINPLFGFWMGMNDDTIAVGSNLGAYIYTRRGAGWEFTQKLPFFTENGGANNILPGTGFAFTNGMMLVGAQGARINSGNSRGVVLVYTRNASGQWVEMQRLLASDGAAGDQFGASLAASGNTLVVGAVNDAIGANAAQGSAYVFTFNGTTWTEQQKITAADGAANDQFGTRAAVAGDTLVIGTPAKAVNGNAGHGAAYVFTRTGSVWTQQQRVTPSDGDANFRFGDALAVEGETLVVGAPGAAAGGRSFTGAAYLYTRSGAAWTERQKLFDATGAAGDQFGISLALAGERLYVGESAADYPPNWPSMGAVLVYTRGGDAFQRRAKIFPYDTNHNKNFGFRLALAGNRLAVTAVSEQVYGVTGAGAAYVLDTTQIRFAPPESDFDGDGKADAGVFRPSERNWYLNRSSSGFAALQFGLANDKIVPADYDGDGRTDIAVWREGAPGTAGFYIFQSSDNTTRFEAFGQTGDNPTLAGDWDGDGRADPAVYRDGPQSYFYYRGSLNNPDRSVTFLPWGAAGDKPVRGDFDGDGRLDAAVFRPSNGAWYIRRSGDGALRVDFWGLATDKFVPADYDRDGKTDLAVYRGGTWYIKQSATGAARYESYGLASDTPVPVDYDGDGRADVAVWRNGTWYIRQSSNGAESYINFGTSGDQPLAAAFVQ